MSVVQIIVLLVGSLLYQPQPEMADGPETETTVSIENAVRTIRIVGIDKMKFVVAEDQPGIVTGAKVESTTGEIYRVLESIKAQPGQKLKIVLTTKSEIPAQAMSHNWILLKPGAQADEFDKDAVLAVDNNYIPAQREKQIIAHTGLAQPGETVEVTFTVPEMTGSYDYLCSFPGHFANGMRGELTVRD